MADRYRTPGGWTVEVVQLAAGQRLRIRHHGYYVADVLSVDDLGRWIPAAEVQQLEADTLIPDAWPQHPSCRYPARAWACPGRRAPLGPARDLQVPRSPRALSAGGRAARLGAPPCSRLDPLRTCMGCVVSVTATVGGA